MDAKGRERAQRGGREIWGVSKGALVSPLFKSHLEFFWIVSYGREIGRILWEKNIMLIKEFPLF